MLRGLANKVLEGLADEEGNIPAAIASAAYGYTRGGQFSPFNAAIFAFFGYRYPILSTVAFAGDAVFIQDTPARRYAAEQYRLAKDRRAEKVKKLAL